MTPSAQTVAPVSSHFGTGPVRVLVVDDDEALRRIVCRILERAGYSCLGAADTSAARTLIAAAEFDLLLCDVQLPGESGVSLARELAADHPDTAIVMVSGLDDPVIAESALSVGAYGYMIKPVANNELLIGVQNALRRRALEHENRMVVKSLEERQSLLERLTRIQRSISRRAALDEVLIGIVDGAHELLGEEVAALCLIDEESPSCITAVASRGISDDELVMARRAAVGDGAAGRAIAEKGLVVVHDGPSPGARVPPFTGLESSTAAMAVPVRQNEELIGCLVVASRTRGRTFTAAEQEMLEAFAVHASLALTDARLLEQVHDALHDPLTGLPNRALFTERLQESLTGSPAGDPDPAVLLLALDRLGVINETLGHSAGDMLLSAVAERLKECAAPSDTVARFAGGDFAILVADAAGRAEPEAVANRVLAAFTSPVQMGGREIAVSASIGIACGGTDADEALRHAGVAMHRARREGKGRYVRFSSEMKAALLRGLELEADLLRAVERKQFAVHYQPIVALNAHELIGFEALVRWRHPERGMVPPLAFIPLAEEMGLIDQIGSFVLREACGQAARWHAEHTTDPPLAIAVNLSARQLQRADLVDEVGDLLSEFGLEPRGLILEITESILMRDADMAVSRLWDLKRLGVRIAIDDFGTGYSSLQYIQSFPLDILKIAKPFIDGVARSAEGAALVRTIADLAKSFRLEVVAEGIETAPQYAALKRLGCQLGQGHHFHRPVDRETAARLLRRAAAGYGLKGDPGSPDLRLPGRGEPQARPAPALRSTRRVPI